MTALELKLRQLCKYQDDVALGIEAGDEYTVRRGIRLRDQLIEHILEQYDLEGRALMLPVSHVTLVDVR